MITKFLIDGIDRLGKSTLIQGIQHALGYHQVMHFSKPQVLDCYMRIDRPSRAYSTFPLHCYQESCFRNLFSILRDAKYTRIICDRTHLGETVYAPIYRGYDGEYVFALEEQFNASTFADTRLILLVEDFDIARHFVDDGESFDIKNRIEEQHRFVKAFDASAIRDKRVICVTDEKTGEFKDRELILKEAIA